MKKILIIWIFILTFGCNSTNNKEVTLNRGYAKIGGKVNIDNIYSKVVSFSGNSILGKISQNAIIDSLGNFNTEIELANAQVIYFSHQNNFASVYLKPNDSLFVEYDSVALAQNTFKISGANKSTNEYIHLFFNLRNQSDFEPNYGDSISVQEYLLQLKLQMQVEDSILVEFTKKYKPNKEFIHWAKKFNKYNMAYNLLLYYWYFDVNRQQLKPEVYNTKIFPVDDDSAIVSGVYLEYLENYLMAKYYRNNEIVKLQKEKGGNIFEVSLERINKNEKPGLSREYMIYTTLKLSLDNSFPNQDSVWSKNIKLLSKKYFKNILTKKKKSIENQRENSQTTLGLSSDPNSETIKEFWKTLSEKHNNKFIYIDIWATWCAPCRAEIPFSIDLQNRFKDQQIAFVNLCLASQKDEWEKSIYQLKIKGDNYYFNQNETEIMRGYLKFQGYPTYMIMDKNGRMIDNNAPRPSSKEKIVQYLNGLLKQY